VTHQPQFGGEGRRFFRRLTPWIGALAGLAAATALLVSGGDFALGIALGALFGYANLRLLGRSVLAMLSGSGSRTPAPLVSDPEADPEDIVDFSQSAANKLHAAFDEDDAPAPASRGNFVRLPLLALAMILILWYMPARPEGFLLGFVISLLAAIGAAIQASRLDGRSP